MTTTPKAPAKKARKKIPPDARAIAALAILLEGVDDDKIEEGFQAIIENLKPRVLVAWSERRLKKEVHDPLAAAVATGDPKKVLEVIVTNKTAVGLIDRLHQNHLTKQTMDQTLADAKAG